jgi:hypothetical protein
LIVMPKLWALEFVGYIAAQREGIFRRRHSIRRTDFNFGSARGDPQHPVTSTANPMQPDA